MTFQARVLAAVTQDWRPELSAIERSAASIRPPNNTKTGTVSRAGCAYLMAITSVISPRIAIEIGTFIGSSILSIRATKHRYTCDRDNDCFTSQPGITAYSRTGSTDMLAELLAKGVCAEFMFFDGRLQDDDLPMIRRLSTPQTVYAFDDFTGHEKGIWNVRRFIPLLPGYRLIPPPKKVPGYKGDTTIAVLIPEAFA